MRVRRVIEPSRLPEIGALAARLEVQPLRRLPALDGRVVWRDGAEGPAGVVGGDQVGDYRVGFPEGERLGGRDGLLLVWVLQDGETAV